MTTRPRRQKPSYVTGLALLAELLLHVPSLTFSNSTFRPKRTVVWFVCGSQSEQRLFPSTKLTGFYNPRQCVFTAGYELDVIDVNYSLRSIHLEALATDHLHIDFPWFSSGPENGPTKSSETSSANLIHLPWENTKTKKYHWDHGERHGDQWRLHRLRLLLILRWGTKPFRQSWQTHVVVTWNFRTLLDRYVPEV